MMIVVYHRVVHDLAALDRLERRLAAEDPALLRAADEVDLGLLRWFLELTPFDRLRSCTQATRALGEFRRVAPEDC